MVDEWKEAKSGLTWNFEENPELVGTLIAVEDHVGQNDSMLYQIQDEDGNVHRVWGSTMLDDLFKQIHVGDSVKVVFKGKEKNKVTGRTLKRYELYYRRKEVLKK